MDTSKIIIGTVGGGRYTVTAPIVKEDYGLYLKIEGLELPATYEVDFSNSENSGTSVTMIGNSDGVLIPHQFIDTGKDIFAFLYHVGADFGRTVYKFRIPNKLRPDRTNEEPTPEQQSVIDQAIAALNDAVEQTAQDVIDADASAQSASESAESAEASAMASRGWAESAEDYAQSAEQSELQASASATASANSASQSAQIKDDVEGMVDDAQASASASAQSASASANSASQASGYAQSASASARSASGYASNASTSAQTASTKATEANTSAQTASQKATEATQSATNASQSAQTAEQAKTASQTAQGLAESARDTAVSAKNDAESAKADAESARDEAQQAVASISGALADKAPVITDTASGAIASFSDGADDLPLKSLVVDINPVQDLHGQDAPYPAGGGKNKITATEYGGDLYSESAGKDLKSLVDVQDYTENGNVITVNVETAWRGRLFATSALPAGDYHVHFETTEAGTRATIYVTDADLVVERYIANKLGAGTTSTNVTLTDSQQIAIIFANNQVGTVTVTNLQVESGSSYTAWSPYENICPISGHDTVEVLDDPACGGTIEWNQLVTNGNMESNDGWISAPQASGAFSVSNNILTCTMTEEAQYLNIVNNTYTQRLVKGHKYLYSVNVRSSAWADSSHRAILILGGYWVRAIFTDIQAGTWVNISGIWTSTIENVIQATFRKYPDANYSPFDVKEFMVFDLTQMFGAGNEPATVEAFRALFPNDYYEDTTGEETCVSAVNGNPYRHITIPLGQTVYGGHLDIVSGVMTVDRAMVDLGIIRWFKADNHFYAVDIKNAIKSPSNNSAVANILCTQYKTESLANVYNETVDKSIAIQATPVTSKGNINIYDSAYSSNTGAEFKNTLNGVMLCYELAEPIEIQLSANQLNSLYGVNNIWADSGDTEVEYRADTKLFIERLTAPDSADMIADSNITSGQYFMVGNSLYKATANIANGAQIIVGTNCIRKSLSEALNEINA